MNTLLYGIHVIQSLLQKNPERVLEIYCLKTREDNRLQEIISIAYKNNISLQKVDKKQLDHWTQNANHQGVAAKVRRAETLTEDDLMQLISENQSVQKKSLLLILDGVQDPHNLGACLRTADAAGANALVIPKDRAASLTPLVEKIASGAAETVPVIEVTNLARTLEQMKQAGVWLIGASSDARDSLYQVDLTGSIALVLGSEGTGLRRLTAEKCDILMKIPMQGQVESLNVSVATGICLYEALRQRQYAGKC